MRRSLRRVPHLQALAGRSAYPPDVLQANAATKMMGEIGELRRGLKSDARQMVKKGMNPEDFADKTKATREKITERSGEFEQKRRRTMVLGHHG